MRPRFRPALVNHRFGDPALHVDFLMERRAMLFDLGNIRALPPRAALRLSDVFVSHAHVDHFIGFDQLLRLLVGREKRLRLYGPAGFTNRVEARLNGYTWNLADRYRTDLVFSVTEIEGDGRGRRAKFRLKNRFKREAEQALAVEDGILRDEASLRVRFAVLEHHTPCLAFALEERIHLNIWRTGLENLGLTVGPWLAALKHAIHDGLADETPIAVRRSTSEIESLPLGLLRRQIVSETRGQKIAYVTDAGAGAANAKAIIELARGADILFIGAPFAQSEAARAAERAHLTTAQAGALARAAEVGRVEPFHFSPLHTGQGDLLMEEVAAAFSRRAEIPTDQTRPASVSKGSGDTRTSSQPESTGRGGKP